MAHGTPLGIGSDEERYGLEGAFLIEAGISSSWHIAQFFGLTAGLPKSAIMASAAQVPADVLVETVTATSRATGDRRFKPREPSGRRVLDINAVITRALTAAGLMK
jgi:hypothetical protein